MNFDDDDRDLLTLCSLSEIWNRFFMVVSNSIPSLGSLKFDDVVGVILSEEMRRKNTGETSRNTLTM